MRWLGRAVLGVALLALLGALALFGELGPLAALPGGILWGEVREPPSPPARSARLRAGGELYELRAIRLEAASEIDRLLPSFVRDRMRIEATGLHFDPAPARYPGTQLRQWFFRLEPAA